MDKTACSAPVFLLAGGYHLTGRRPDALLASIFGQIGVQAPAVAYVGSANGDDPGFFQWAGRLLREAGAGRVALAPTAGVRNARAAQSTMESADVIFVSGGDTEEGMRLLGRLDLSPFLRGLHAQGKAFMGLSAGSLMLASQWVRWRDPDDDSTAETFDCLGIAPVPCDTHGEQDGWEELRALVGLLPEGTVGYGICSATALRVDSARRVTPLGGPVDRLCRRSGKVVALSPLCPGDNAADSR